LSPTTLAYIFFFYGLAFFSMGLAITLEIGHISNPRLKHALRPLAVFGVVHGGHEWMEMFENLGFLPWQAVSPGAVQAVRIGILAISFLSLSAFGASLLATDERSRRVSNLVPMGQAALWGCGILALRARFPDPSVLPGVVDVWTRYILAILGALMACAGLLAQQRAFRQAGLVRFGWDSLWAAIAFAWYGVVGQVFTRPSPLPPSTVINSDLFLEVVGFPIQLLRAVAAIMVAIFVVRFLRSWEVEIQRKLAELQASRLEEAERREIHRGELLRQVVAAQEAERTRIARELHDATGQALTAIGLGLRGVTGILYQDLEKAARNLREMQSLVARSLTELQQVIADLRPSHLDDLGLPAALRWYAGEVQARGGVSVDVEVRGEHRPMAGETVTALFRVAQEALANVLKHAGASRARVDLVYDPAFVELSVEDDGRGFDAQAAETGRVETWGLAGMRERASLVGGELTVDSAPGEGTRIRIRLPQRGEARRDNGDSSAAGG
jgi:signal transduction histidine kinase